jgi:hypothetical protein
LLLFFGAVYFGVVRGVLALASQRCEEDPTLKTKLVGKIFGGSSSSGKRWPIGAYDPCRRPNFAAT